MKPILITVIAALIAIFSWASSAEARARLTKSEVQKLFIGKSWRGPTGTFHFKNNGTYTFRKRQKTGGPWNYQLKSDGTIRGASTSYQFYRKRNGDYQYWHTRSRRYFPAFVN